MEGFDRAAFLSSLVQLLGPQHLLHDGELSRFEVDWRQRYRGRALAVALPADVAQVQELIRICASQHVPVVPQGGNTGLVGGGVPDESGRQLVLSLARMRRIRGVDEANLTMTAEAGCVLQAVQEAAAARDLLFPLSLAAEGSCTIGGNLATNAGGTQVLRHGNARDLCLGLEVVTAQGDCWSNLQGLRKDNSGYDLRQLMIGSEGTLGIITAATLKLCPAPRAQLTAWAQTHTLPHCITLLDRARRQLGCSLSGFEVMNAHALELVALHFPALQQPGAAAPWSVLLELSDDESCDHAQQRLESLLSAALEAGVIANAVVASSVAQSRALWHLRESIPLAQAAQGLNIKHDISMPVSGIPAFVEAADAALQRLCPGSRLVNFGHLGDGNLHYNLQAPQDVDAGRFLAANESAVNAVVFDLVTAHGGSISAEHGVGQLKRDEIARRKNPAALAQMRAIKRALDPQNLLNPGRLIEA